MASQTSQPSSSSAHFQEDEDEETMQMKALMGFGGFDSTAGKDVGDPRSKMEAVNKKEMRRYRQYMNRRGGFNRPLDET